MIDKNLIMAKAGKVDGHLRRIKAKRSLKLEEFLGDLDIQESILFNLQMAAQNCIDIAAHVISDDELGVAGSTNEMFYVCFGLTAGMKGELWNAFFKDAGILSRQKNGTSCSRYA